MPTLTVQLYSLRNELAADFEGTLREVAKIGFPCVETAGYHDRKPAEVAGILKDCQLVAPTAHCALPVGDAKNEVIETALELGHRYLITGGPPGWRDDFSTTDQVKAAAEDYAKAADNAAEHAEYIGVELDAYAGDMLEAVRKSYAYLTAQGIAEGRE